MTGTDPQPNIAALLQANLDYLAAYYKRLRNMTTEGSDPTPRELSDKADLICAKIDKLGKQ